MKSGRVNAFRIGHGYDAHRLVEGRRLILGGVDVPFERGLLGHSDADVLTHAVMDSIIGALSLGDIGKHFPDSDEKYKGARSIGLLRICAKMMGKVGYSIANLDATVIAQKPKLSPYIEEMKKNIAEALSCDTESINIKATTEENMGFTGSGEGISAHCVAILANSGG